MVGILRHTLLTYTCRSSRTVVAIGNIQGRNLREQLRNTLILRRIAHNPEVMTKAICRSKIIVGLIILHNILNDGVNLIVIGISKEYGLDISLLVTHVNHTILLLIGACKLVLLDSTREVILKVTAHCNTILRAAIHRLRIDIIVLLGVLLQPAALLPRAEVIHSLLIHLLRMLVGNGVEVNLRLNDMQQRTLGSLRFCFYRIQHIVGT